MDVVIRLSITEKLPLQIVTSKSTGNEVKIQEWLGTSLDERYPKMVNFRQMNNNISELQLNAVYDVHCDVESRGWIDSKGVVRYSTTLTAWKVEPAQMQQMQIPQQPMVQAPQAQMSPTQPQQAFQAQPQYAGYAPGGYPQPGAGVPPYPNGGMNYPPYQQ